MSTGNTSTGFQPSDEDKRLAEEIRAKRKDLGMTVESFWDKLGISKSGGSRYENLGREIPEPVRRLFQVTYLHSKDHNPLEKFGEDGRKVLDLLENKEFADALLKQLLKGRK